MLDSLVGSIDGAHYETMGTLDYGRVFWAQVDPNVKIRVGDDESDVLLTFHTSHDGSKKTAIFETIYREVCKNTFNAGWLNRLTAMLAFKHTKNVKARMADVTAQIGEIRNVAMSMQDKLTLLSQKRVTRESLDSIFDRLFPKTVQDNGTEVSSTRRDNILADVLKLYESNDNDAFPQFRGTGYNLLNAVTEYTDHYRTSHDGAGGRAESATFGSGARLKDNALKIILEVTKDAPTMVARTYGASSQGIGSDVVSELLAAS